MHKNDIIIDYKVVKDSELPDMKKIIHSIYKYVQNNEVYFKYEPKIIDGVLIFGIVGFRHKHNNLLKIMGNDVRESGGKLEIMVDRSK